jgi:hypothetical protein
MRHLSGRKTEKMKEIAISAIGDMLRAMKETGGSYKRGSG